MAPDHNQSPYLLFGFSLELTTVDCQLSTSFGSDTGIRTRVSAVRGRRPGPLDDIAIAVRCHFRCVRHSLKCSHANTPRASSVLTLTHIGRSIVSHRSLLHALFQ